MNERSLKERVVEATKTVGVLPCIKLGDKRDCLPYARAMAEGGARVIEITMTTPGALEAIEAVASELKGRVFVAAGTVLDAGTAREVIRHGGSLLVNPAVLPEVIEAGLELGVPVYSGAFTATECLRAMRAGADMVKIFPAQVGGPKYMTNLKMVFPDVDLIPSGGISLANAGDFIRCGACAVSGNRVFMNAERIEAEGFGWLADQVRRMISAVQAARLNPAPAP
jgi:2-dehydro-3-deoxyphosphogluconate aldolase / (4S)-4-hydroxy-2-oxoglutarate aldolase